MGRNERQAEQAGLGLSSLNGCNGLWGTGAVPRCLVPGSGVIRTGIVAWSVRSWGMDSRLVGSRL